MKRTLALLVTLALSISMLVACGGNSGEGGNSGGFGTSKVLSEYLAKEDTICYKVKAMDKAETPENIYFFKDGKVTIIPGKEFGLTMGDFSKMTDKEIWEKLEEVKVTYAENYVAEKLEELQKRINSKKKSIASCQSSIEEYAFYVEEIRQAYGDEEAELAYYEKGIADDVASCEAQIAELESEIAELEKLNTESACKLPYLDMPFYFVVTTDASGNQIAEEKMVYPTQNYDLRGFKLDPEDEKPCYDYLGFALGLTGQYEIYDSTYTGLATSGSGQFCMRETLEFDTLDSKNILVDQTKDELNALFEAEINARYE